jgi:homoprotocatechuate degradation regulator HpaR
MSSKEPRQLAPYRQSLAGTLLAAREAVMAPIRPILRAAGVTEQQWRVLRVLDRSGPIDPTTLAQDALLYPPTVTRILKEMVERGLIVRETDLQDGRRSILILTPAGSALMRRTAEHTIRMLDIYSETFGEARLRHLIDEVRALTEAIGSRQHEDQA